MSRRWDQVGGRLRGSESELSFSNSKSATGSSLITSKSAVGLSSGEVSGRRKSLGPNRTNSSFHFKAKKNSDFYIHSDSDSDISEKIVVDSKPYDFQYYARHGKHDADIVADADKTPKHAKGNKYQHIIDSIDLCLSSVEDESRSKFIKDNSKRRTDVDKEFENSDRFGDKQQLRQKYRNEDRVFENDTDDDGDIFSGKRLQRQNYFYKEKNFEQNEYESDDNVSDESEKDNDEGYSQDDQQKVYEDNDIDKSGDSDYKCSEKVALGDKIAIRNSRPRNSGIGKVDLRPSNEQRASQNSQTHVKRSDKDKLDNPNTGNAYVDKTKVIYQRSESKTTERKLTRSKSDISMILRQKTILESREEAILPIDRLLDHAAFYKNPKLKTEPEPTHSKQMTDPGFMIEVSKLEIQTCISALLFGDYIVLIFPDKVVKQSRETKKNLSYILIKQAHRLCYTAPESSIVGVLQMPLSRITLLETKRALIPLYIIDLQSLGHTVSSICCMHVNRKPAVGLPDPMHVFCVAGGRATLRTNDKLTIVSAAKCRQGGSRTPIYPVKIRHHFANQFRGITDLSALSWNKVVISCFGGIKCICYDSETFETSVLWTFPSAKCISDVCCYKVGTQTKVLASFQNDNRIMHLDSDGNVRDDNVLPKGSALKPDKISVWNNEILVKQFNEPTWCSYVTEPPKDDLDETSSH